MLKILSSQQVLQYQILYIVSFFCYSSQPVLGPSLRVFSGRWTFVCFTSVVDDSFSSLTLGLIPDMLRTVTTEVSLFVACIAFYFPDVLARTPSSSSSLHKPSSWRVRGCVVVDVF